MKVIAYSNRGPTREHNEDALFASGNVISGCSMAAPLEIDIEAQPGCLAVIDGMGGYEGGELAARLAALSFLEDSGGWYVSAMMGRERIERILERAVQLIGQTVAQTPGLASMGAALAGVAFCADAMLAFNCGDCRVYRQQSGYLQRLTHDHSIVQELFDQGEIEEDEMRTHPRKNTVTACVSADPSYLTVAFHEVPYTSGGRFLICSDGVWEALSIEELEASLKDRTMAEGASALAKGLLDLGGECRDNVSFLLVDTGEIDCANIPTKGNDDA